MDYKYIKYFPKPFLEDLISGKTVPFIGAGFSKNAEIPVNKSMLDWNQLGEKIAEEMDDYKYTNAIDALSAYSYEFSRSKLIEKLSSLLLVNSVKPGKTHTSFCKLQFDIVCTTNFEFLIEDGYKLVNKYCRPIIDEDQLSISSNSENIALLKLHGDLHHPTRLVVTEEDYDRFLNQYPMLSTYLANLLIKRTALFIGYSLDDTDFRQIWQLIKDRLGKLRRQAYVLKVDCSANEKARFERRGVKVINIEGEAKDYPVILEKVFEELNHYWTNTLLSNYIISEDNAMAELLLPEDSKNRLCFFSIPIKLLPFYKKFIFPVVRRSGLIPISSDDVITIGDNWIAKTTALINKSEFVILDISTPNTLFELGILLSKQEANTKILLINDENSTIPSNISGYPIINRTSDPYENAEDLAMQVENWLKQLLALMEEVFLEEPNRLLMKNEYRAAVISAISQFEDYLRKSLIKRSSRKRKPLYSLVQLAISRNIIEENKMADIKEWMRIRNHIVHSKKDVSHFDAQRIVNGVKEIIEDTES